MLEKISRALTRKPKLVVLVAVLLLIPSVLGAAMTRINYDILSYLPQDLDSAKGEALLEEPFHMAATTMLIVEGMPPAYTHQLQKEVEQVPGVSNAIWLSSLVGIQIPEEMLPEDIRDIFFSGDATMMIVQYEQPGASEATMKSIEQVRSLCNKNCFLAGFSVFIKDTKDLISKEMPLYVVMAAVLSIIAMCVTMESWLLPVALMLSIGLAILYNFGSNILLGEISFITQAIAAVLQLGVTMDYSIFLYHRYVEEAPHYEDRRDAMAVSIVAAFKSLSGSSLTTIAGFLALCFMRLTLGRDLGLVMAKGVVLGVATVVLVLPAILLLMDGPIRRYRHPALAPNMGRLNAFIVRHRHFFVALFFLLFFPAVYSNNHTQVYYKLDQSLPQDMPSIVSTDKLKDEFNMASSHFIVMRDDISRARMKELEEAIDEIPGITSVVAYDKLISGTIPDFFIPDEIKDLCKQDGYQMMMVNSEYVTASDAVSQQLSQLSALVKSYDPEAYITGEAAMTDDLITVSDSDFKLTNYLSIIAILILVAFTFRSISIPILLVSTIELAIFINQGIPYFSGTVIAFVAPTVIGCVQLGATVDYAILMTTRFQEELQKGKDRKEAIQIAATSSDISIITSALVFFCSTLGVALISTMDIVSSICLMLSRGAVISALVSIFILPSVLVVFEPIIARTSLWWRTPKPPKDPQNPQPGKQALSSAGKH
ncbi:efflux RND transporter permease subunit [Intestinimonas butyriciproducens]|uniref:efflux RND transporter permease subunit n=1 Tax=Intestinimonas butyriciproducens TaxID=1297617 RepID=UPI00232E8E25|nr:MMPL family transporter [Intestinimonas butyriciproducens]MDB7860558.1 MMPL family transporter [Intestinimonas butyriciproducens]MDB7862720.1 MMPL family transporter [Intestinimonas butyriciproducens]